MIFKVESFNLKQLKIIAKAIERIGKEPMTKPAGNELGNETKQNKSTKFRFKLDCYTEHM